MEVQVAVAKIRKYATSTSGDTVEVVERPNGGVSIVLADGQSSGRGAKTISNLVVRKVITLLAEGVRDGAAARAASDSLFTERKGKVSATLNILSVDLHTHSLVITRNNPAPVIIGTGSDITVLEDTCTPIGLYRATRPIINEIALNLGLTVVIFSDGLLHAGDKFGKHLDVPQLVKVHLSDKYPVPQLLADQLLYEAVVLDDHRPVDDISIVVLGVLPYSGDETRRMTVRLPLD